MYLPDPLQLTSNNTINETTYDLRAILLSLQGMLGRVDHNNYEGLVQRRSGGKQAQKLVRITGIPQPPRLVNLAKAWLAKMHFSMQNMILKINVSGRDVALIVQLE